MDLYNYICGKCGWTSGPTSHLPSKCCPQCKQYSLGAVPINEEARKTGETNGIFNAILLVIIMMIVGGLVALIFPGTLIAMFIEPYVGSMDILWSWIAVVAISFLIFAICGFKFYRYLLLGLGITAICAILIWLFEDFSPFDWGLKHLFNYDIWQ